MAGHTDLMRVESGEIVRRVLFRRRFTAFFGSHLKVWDYFNHVNTIPGYEARIFLTPDSVPDRGNPWTSGDEMLAHWSPHDADLLFLSGTDWEGIAPTERDRFARPVINLVQALQNANPQDYRFPYLRHRAIRICCSDELHEAISATGCVNGPVFTIPNGLDRASMPPGMPAEARAHDLLIAGHKAPDLAARLAKSLAARHHGLRLAVLTEVVSRNEFLAALADARTAILLPLPTEGFYLPALEAMQVGTLVVCPDVGGNRSFCTGRTAIVPRNFGEAALLEAADRALALGMAERDAIVDAAAAVAAPYTLERERSLFEPILRNVDQLW